MTPENISPSSCRPKWYAMLRSQVVIGHTASAGLRAREILSTWLKQKWAYLAEPEVAGNLEQGRSLHVRHDRTTLDVSASEDGSWRAWLLQPDREVQQRSWCTRVLLQRKRNGATLAHVENGYWAPRGLQTLPTVPQFIRIWSQDLQTRDGPLYLTDEPVLVNNAGRLASLEESLFSSARVLPLLLLTPHARTTGYGVNVRQLAAQLLGVAHVVPIDELNARALAQQLGPALGAYNGAVRLFSPALRDDETPEAHPLFLPPKALCEAPMEVHRGFQRYLQEQALAMAMAVVPPLSAAEGELHAVAEQVG